MNEGTTAKRSIRTRVKLKKPQPTLHGHSRFPANGEKPIVQKEKTCPQRLVQKEVILEFSYPLNNSNEDGPLVAAPYSELMKEIEQYTSMTIKISKGAIHLKVITQGD